MWQTIRIHVGYHDQVTHSEVSHLLHRHSLKYMSFPIEKVGYIFIVHPHSPNDRVALQALSGVTILEHPYNPKSLCQGTHTVLTGHLLATDTPYSMWTKLHALHPHPALHPDA